MASYKEIDVTELQTLLGNSGVTLVDVRSDGEVAGGMIDGAQHIVLDSLPAKAEELAGEGPLVFYCHSGIRSAHACAFMSDKVSRDLFNLRGGIVAWAKAGNILTAKS